MLVRVLLIAHCAGRLRTRSTGQESSRRLLLVHGTVALVNNKCTSVLLVVPAVRGLAVLVVLVLVGLVRAAPAISQQPSCTTTVLVPWPALELESLDFTSN